MLPEDRPTTAAFAYQYCIMQISYTSVICIRVCMCVCVCVCVVVPVCDLELKHTHTHNHTHTHMHTHNAKIRLPEVQCGSFLHFNLKLADHDSNLLLCCNQVQLLSQ